MQFLFLRPKLPSMGGANATDANANRAIDRYRLAIPNLTCEALIAGGPGRAMRGPWEDTRRGMEHRSSQSHLLY